MKVATWNVNSLRVRLPQVQDWVGTHKPDILCLQETKLDNPRFPLAEINELGYEVCYSGQPTYNGVATLSRTAPSNIVLRIPRLRDEQKRVIAADVNGVRIINLYVPNGEAVGSEKYRYKLRWLARLREWLQQELARHKKLLVLGDFNIAPDDRDVYNPKSWAGSVLCSDKERTAFTALLQLGLIDTFRQFDQPEGLYSWWDYRRAAFAHNRGLRIDHILASPEMARTCRSCSIDRKPRELDRPSDHAPVVAEFT